MKQGLLHNWQLKYDQQKHRKTLAEIKHRRGIHAASHSPGRRLFHKTCWSPGTFEIQLQNEALLRRLTAIADRKPAFPKALAPLPLRLGARKLQAQQLHKENQLLVERLSNPDRGYLLYPQPVGRFN